MKVHGASGADMIHWRLLGVPDGKQLLASNQKVLCWSYHFSGKLGVFRVLTLHFFLGQIGHEKTWSIQYNPKTSARNVLLKNKIMQNFDIKRIFVINWAASYDSVFLRNKYSQSVCINSIFIILVKSQTEYYFMNNRYYDRFK